MYYPITPGTGLADSRQKSPSVVERLGRIGWKNDYSLVPLVHDLGRLGYLVTPVVLIPRRVDGVDVDFDFPCYTVGLTAMGAGEKIATVHLGVSFRLVCAEQAITSYTFHNLTRLSHQHRACPLRAANRSHVPPRPR